MSNRLLSMYVDSVTRSVAPRRVRRQASAWPVVIFVGLVVLLAGMK